MGVRIELRTTPCQGTGLVWPVCGHPVHSICSHLRLAISVTVQPPIGRMARTGNRAKLTESESALPKMELPQLLRSD